MGQFLIAVANMLLALFMFLVKAALASGTGALGVYHIVTWITEVFESGRDGFAEAQHRHRGITEMIDDIVSMLLFTWALLGGFNIVIAIVAYVLFKSMTKRVAIGPNAAMWDELRDDLRKWCRILTGAMLMYAASALVVGFAGTGFLGADVEAGVLHMVTDAVIKPSAGQSGFGAFIYGVIGAINFLINLIFSLPLAALLIVNVLGEMLTKARVGWRQLSWDKGLKSVMDDLVSISLITLTLGGGFWFPAGLIGYLVWGVMILDSFPNFGKQWRMKFNYDIGNWCCLCVASLMVYYGLHGETMAALIRLLIRDAFHVDFGFL